MTITQIRYFVEVCKWGTLSRAAAELHVTQPALSGAIKDLERHLGVNLFRRSGRNIILTADGEFLLSKASGVIHNIDSMINDMDERSRNKKNIRIAMPLLTGAYLIPMVLGDFKQQHPDIEIDMVEIGGIDSIKMVENEEIDLAIVNYEHQSEKINYINLFNSEICLCVHKSNPIAAKKNIIMPADIIDQPLVMLKGGFLISELVQSSFERFSIKPRIIFETTQLHTVKNLIHNNIAASFLVKESVCNDQDIVAISCKELLKFNGAIITKNGRQIYSDTRLLIEFLLNKFQHHNHQHK